MGVLLDLELTSVQYVPQINSFNMLFKLKNKGLSNYTFSELNFSINNVSMAYKPLEGYRIVNARETLLFMQTIQLDSMNNFT